MELQPSAASLVFSACIAIAIQLVMFAGKVAITYFAASKLLKRLAPPK